MILGISDQAKIKKPARVRIGLPGETSAELTKLGWYIVSPGKDNGITSILFS